MKLQGCILTPQGWIEGHLTIQEGRIASLEGRGLAESEVRSGRQPIWIPGFVDLHVHGGGGHDVMQGGNAAARVGALHARHGTTAWLATTLTAPMPEIAAALDALAPLCRRREPDQPRLLGVHLEGPYISPDRRGAHPPLARAADVQEVLALHARAPIRLVTVAPEQPGHLAFIAELRQLGFGVILGHSAATYEQARQAFEAGAQGVTHLFNAMSALHHRAPGMVGAALAHAPHAEIIPDLLHVHPGAIRAALRAIPGLYCVTDATAAAGMPDGEYPLGGQTVHKCLGGVRLADGTLAGSALTMDRAFVHLVELGLSLQEASRRTATLACELLGIHDRGRLAVGLHADLVALDESLGVRQVWVEGQALVQSALV